MNIDTCTTKQRSTESRNPHGLIPDPILGSSSQGIAIGDLDRRDADPHVGFPAEGRILWVSLINPRSLLGPLLDEMSFEGAWLEKDGQARIRLLGQGERRVATPLFHSPDSARLWLASELLKSAADPSGLKFHDSTDADSENLAA